MSAADDVTLTFEQYAATPEGSTWLASPEFAERADALFCKMEPADHPPVGERPISLSVPVPSVFRYCCAITFAGDSKGGRTMTMGSDVCCICGEHLEEDTSNRMQTRSTTASAARPAMKKWCCLLTFAKFLTSACSAYYWRSPETRALGIITQRSASSDPS